MHFLLAALWALQQTRGLLKDSLKSNNKAYDPSKSDLKNATVGQKAKWNRRNANMQEVHQLMNKNGTVVSVKGMSILKAGQVLHGQALADEEEGGWYGNCGEQADIALYLCSTSSKSPYKVDPKNLYIYNYKKGDFEHSLVVLEVKNKKLPKPACCDPWMNIACWKDEYRAKADQKLKEWTGESKRLWVGEDWVESSNAKILGFAAGAPAWIKNALEIPDTKL